MELRDYWRILRKRWRLIAATAFLAVAAAAAVSYATTPLYEARTQEFVSVQSAGDSSQLQQGQTFTQQRVKSYAAIVGTPRVLQPVIDQFHLAVSAGELAQHVTASAPLDTVLVNISVTDPSPQQAATVANAIGESFRKAVADLEKPTDGSASPVRVSTVEPASTPMAPVAPTTKLNLALGLLLGLALGVGLAILRETLDTSIRADRDVEAITPSAVLAGIRFDTDAGKRPLVVHSAPQSPRAEAFRQLRTNLQFVQLDGDRRSFVVTSSVSGEGKSTTSANLALTMAAAGKQVLLIEADLRRPKVAEYLGIEGAVGLTNVLIGQVRLEDVLQPWGTGTLTVLPAGRIPPNPSELLGSVAMRDLLHKLESEFDTIILDAPPLLPVTDAAVLSAIASGAIIVVASGRTRREQLRRSTEILDGIGARTLGVVLNFMPMKGPDAYSYDAYGYGGYESVAQPDLAAPGAAGAAAAVVLPAGRRGRRGR